MADTPSVDYRSDLPQGQNIAPRLGTPGMPDFFASILEFVRVTAPDVPLDPVILQAIVLCVLAGNKHVLLRPREEDITVVQNLAALVSNSIFISITPILRKLSWVSLTVGNFLSFPSPGSPPLHEIYSLSLPDILRHIWLCNPQT